MAFTVRDTSHGAQFALRVQPRASRNAFAGLMGDAIKLAITAPPVDGKANQAVIEYLSEFFRVPKASITIVSGETGRNKLIAIRGMSAAQVLKALKI
ncbi:MAG: YggU family protein [Acidobacteria bacterium]|nr:MAG: YggU family protein [Acidobacteriota bacterium]